MAEQSDVVKKRFLDKDDRNSKLVLAHGIKVKELEDKIAKDRKESYDTI